MPGNSERNLYHPAANLDRKHKFEDFVPFLNTEGLSKREAFIFTLRLRMFYAGAVNASHPPVFQPGSCKRCVDYFQTAEGAFKPWKVSLWFSKEYDHYWYKIATEGNRRLIVDPSGLPRSEECVEEMKAYHAGLDFSGHNIFENPPPQETHNTAFVFRRYYVPFFGLEEKATGFPSKAYKDPESFEVSRDWIGRKINKIYFGF